MNIENIEIVLVVFIVAAQIVIFHRTRKQIKIFKDVIPESASLGISRLYIPRDEFEVRSPREILENPSRYKNPDEMDEENEGFREVSIIECDHENTVFEKILYAINTYLIRNQGATSDFDLIKDITERNADAIEEDINLTISIPLYLGLMGTMLGIVIGLFTMSALSSTLVGRAGDDTLAQGISVLLGGVKIAMVASFFGLLLTIINSGWYYKGSKSFVDANKNDFYAFVQTELLPVVNQSLGSTFDTLQRNLLRFNDEFTGNINRLTGIFDANVEALGLQEKILSSIEKMDIATIAKYNVTVLRQLQDSTKEFRKFNDYFSNLNSFLESSNTLAERLGGIVERTENMQTIANSIEDRLSQSQLLLDFLSKHFQDLETHRQYTKESISEVGFAISDTFKELKEHIQNSSKTLKNFTVEEVDLLKKALSESKTNLSNLQYLESLNEDVSLLKDSSASQSERIRSLLVDLNRNFEKSVQILAVIEQNSSSSTMSGLRTSLKRLFGSKED